MEKIVVNYTAGDYWQANKLCFKTCGLKTSIATSIFILIIVSFKCLRIIPCPPSSPNLCDLQFNSCLPDMLLIIFAFLFPAIHYILLSFISKNYFKKQKLFSSQVKLEFSKDAFVQKDVVAETKLFYSYLNIISKDMILIFSTFRTFIFLPKKYCQDGEQFKRIVEMVRNFPCKRIVDYLK